MVVAARQMLRVAFVADGLVVGHADPAELVLALYT
jgi:hypothetical protein